MEIPAEWRVMLERPVAILGDGVSGRAASEVLRTLSVAYTIFDETHGIPFTLEDAKNCGLVIYSPGFKKTHPWMLAAFEAGCLCITEIDFAAAFFPGLLVAITGTNGKTTTTELLTEAFKAAGMQAVAAGNIGHPLSKAVLLPRAQIRVAVCEVSSFQAEKLTYFSPSAVLWTNFTEDHLDRYADLSSYFAAKWALVERLKKPRLFVGPTVVASAKRYGYELPMFTQVVDFESNVDLALAETVFAHNPQRENYLLAKAYWEAEGLPLQALFQGAFNLPDNVHRLCDIRSLDGIRFWNDSKATNFGSACAAAKSFSKPVLWIGGGSFKGGDVVAFVQDIAPYVKEAFLIGHMAEAVARELKKVNKKFTIFDSLKRAVESAYFVAEEGDNILFSPGFASFDMFKNYADRGNCFMEVVLGLNSKLKLDRK